MATLSKLHFRRIALALYSSRPDARLAAPDHDLVKVAAQHQYNDTCRSVATALAEFNPQFDRDKFLTFCGVPQ